MSKEKPRIVAIHGVSELKNAKGFSTPMREAVKETIREANKGKKKHERIEPVRWLEAVYSDLSDISQEGPFADTADFIVDAVKYSQNSELREQIAERLRERIRPNDIVIAHSLGSVAAIRELVIAANVRGEKPFSALMTMGSPAGLMVPRVSLPGFGEVVFDWRTFAQNLQTPRAKTRLSQWGIAWVDFWSAHDPIHTGKLSPLFPSYGAQGLASVNYPCTSIRVEQGTNPLTAHTFFWRNKIIAAHAASLWSRVTKQWNEARSKKV